MIVVVLCAIALNYDYEIGLAYTLASACLVLPIYVLRVPQRFFYVMLFAAISLWVTHMLRPLVLLVDMDLFKFPIVGYIDKNIMIDALFKIAQFNVLVLSGLFLGFKAYALQPNKVPVLASEFKMPFFLRGRFGMNVLLIFFFLLKLFLIVAFNLGSRGEQADASIGFILRLMPDFLIYPICLLYLARYNKQLKRRQVAFYAIMLLGYSGLVLLQGSKMSLALTGFAVFIYYLSDKGDFKVHLLRAITLGAFGALIMVFSFVLGSSLRYYVRSYGFNAGLITHLADEASTVTASDKSFEYADDITSRFLGFDGVMVTDMYQPAELRRVFSPVNTLNRILDQLLPFYAAQGNLTSGRAVSIIYMGFSDTHTHTGGVGLLGALVLMSGTWAIWLGFLLGFGVAAYFAFSERSGSRDLSFVLYYVGLYFLINIIMAGAMERNIALALINVIHVFFYYFMIRFVNSFRVV